MHLIVFKLIEFWKLEINIAKSKMMILNKRKMKQNFDFKLQVTNIEVVEFFRSEEKAS